jgi:hypothetical protein
MSVIAGVVRLTPGELLTEENLHPMLEAMRPSVPSEIETCAMTGNTAIIGKLVYGPNTNGKQKHGKVIEKPHVFSVGEIYNDEVAQAGSAEQFLLERYLRRGVEDFATGLNGSFSAVIADPRDGSVTLVTDHTGSWPFYTVIHSNKLYFASEVKALAGVAELPCEPDLSSALSLVARSFFVSRRTLMKNVLQMDYAAICHIRGGKVRSWPYWRYIIEPSSDKGYKYYLEEFAGLLRQAVKRRVSNGRVAIMLSGGIDSRGILCCLDEPSKIPAVTFTSRTLQSRHKLGDWALAEQITNRLGMDLSVIHYDSQDFANAMYESVYASDAAAGFVFENIWGKIREATGAEYLLMGDHCNNGAPGPVSDGRVLPSIGIYSLQNLPELQKYMRHDLLGTFIELSSKDIEAINASCKIKAPCDRIDQLNFEHVLIYLLPPKRRLTARHGMFVRNPWYDLDICNFMRRLPTHHRVGKSLFRKTLRRINPSLSDLPRARVSETADHQNFLGRAEQQQTILKMVFENNPLFEEFFDISSVRELIQGVCSDRGSLKPAHGFDPILVLLPHSFRLKLGAYVKYLMNPTHKLSGIDIVLRIATVAVALRYVAERFKTESSA